MNVLSSKKVKTRKQHSCWGCCRPIPSGKKINRVTTKDGDTLVTAYWCPFCEQKIAKMSYRDIDEGFVEGELNDYDSEGNPK